eukprot:scaffold164557_cov31-Tisochrysis_lutea.AAC.3
MGGSKYTSGGRAEPDPRRFSARHAYQPRLPKSENWARNASAGPHAAFPSTGWSLAPSNGTLSTMSCAHSSQSHTIRQSMMEDGNCERRRERAWRSKTRLQQARLHPAAPT